MTKTTEQLAASKAGQTAETNGMGGQERPLRKSGLYELKNDAGEVVARMIVKTHPLFGDGQAAAAERVGFRFVRTATSDDIKEITPDFGKANEGSVSADDLKGLQARLDALEAENKALKEAKDTPAAETAPAEEAPASEENTEEAPAAKEDSKPADEELAPKADEKSTKKGK